MYGAKSYGSAVYGSYLSEVAASGIDPVYGVVDVTLPLALAGSLVHGAITSIAVAPTLIVMVGSDTEQRESVVNFRLPLSLSVSGAQTLTGAVSVTTTPIVAATGKGHVQGVTAVIVRPAISIISLPACSVVASLAPRILLSATGMSTQYGVVSINATPTFSVVGQQRVTGVVGVSVAYAFSTVAQQPQFGWVNARAIPAVGITAKSGFVASANIKVPLSLAVAAARGTIGSVSVTYGPSVSATGRPAYAGSVSLTTLLSVSASASYLEKIVGACALYPPVTVRGTGQYGVVDPDPMFFYTKTSATKVYVLT